MVKRFYAVCRRRPAAVLFRKLTLFLLPTVTEMDLRTQLKEGAARINTAIEDDLRLLAADHEPLLVEVLRYGLLGGGKRVRPFLVVNAAELCGRTGPECEKLAIAFEYLHAATLFHDDIIDNSALRRGKAAIHQKFGVVAAILAGDFLLAHSMEIVGEYTGRRGLLSFHLATKGMVDGEFEQLRRTDTTSVDIEAYDRTVMRKTGLLIDSTGKRTGNDLHEGKMTLPLLCALECAEVRERLLEVVADPGIRRRAESLVEVRALITRGGGFTAARREAEEAMQRGIDALALFAAPEAAAARDRLAALGRFVLERER
ncbi:hypothetical protein CSA17_06420 [bacterium DOLJORAL78_65_58]|nr:MAG: hypothetical protein CSA17_06420 [bacterium DOLJORAL78_65_58]